jgi:hypothetical protein
MASSVGVVIRRNDNQAMEINTGWRLLGHSAWSQTMSRTILARDSKRPGLDLNHTTGCDWLDGRARPVKG